MKNTKLTSSSNQMELILITYPFLEGNCEGHKINLMVLRSNKQHIIVECISNNAKWYDSLDRFYTYDLLEDYDNVLWLGSDVCKHTRA